MRECLDEGVLQSYFDGELSGEHMESAASHLASCMECASAARELEDEAVLLSNALAVEFDGAVPTERLRHRIDVAVAGLEFGNQNSVREPVAVGGRGWLESLSALFAFTPQRTFGYAALAVMLALGTIIGVIKLRQTPSNNIDTSGTMAGATASPAPITSNPNPGPEKSSDVTAPIAPKASDVASVPVKRPRSERRRATAGDQAVAQVQLLPGERSYLKTIAALDSTIKSSNNRPMRPELRAEYERNLAVVDRALAATRNAAKKNPNDPDAAEFMFNAYQSKVDLLNTVADARLYNRP
ncbi:MAG: zf-HC2 domain-containing protein [Pyrinomonadaceae bacterium]|nr:zf-HC2 domain-containing protein [Pyrinomonadaceae bacterium]